MHIYIYYTCCMKHDQTVNDRWYVSNVTWYYMISNYKTYKTRCSMACILKDNHPSWISVPLISLFSILSLHFYSLNMFESNIYPARDSNIQVLSRPRIFPAEVPIDTYAVPLGAPEVPVAVWNLRINKWCTMNIQSWKWMKMGEHGETWTFDSLNHQTDGDWTISLPMNTRFLVYFKLRHTRFYGKWWSTIGFWGSTWCALLFFWDVKPGFQIELTYLSEWCISIEKCTLILWGTIV